MTPFDRLRLRNVRCFRDTDIAFHPQATVVVGGNASGKTTLMEALASVTHGDDEGLAAFPLRMGTVRGEIAMFEAGRRPAVARWDSRAPLRQRLPHGRFAFLYGRYRCTSLPEDVEDRGLSDAEYLDELSSHAGRSRTTTLTRPDNRLIRDLPGYIRGLSFGRTIDPRLGPIWDKLNDAVSRIDPSLTGIRMDESSDPPIPRFLRGGLQLELSQLSDGYQAILAIVVDLIVRYAYLFLEGDPLAGNALVGIDEIDLHLHPTWQRNALPLLTGLFPGTQFVVTTHSPLVVQSAIDRGLSVIRLAEKRGEVIGEPLPPSLTKALKLAEVGSVLYEHHLFGSERFSVTYTELAKRLDKLEAKVRNGRATATEHQELKRGLDKLEELVYKEDRRRADGSAVAQIARMQARLAKALTDELEKSRS